MDQAFFRKITTIMILAILLILSFFLLKPILMAVIIGFILAFIFSPVYNWIFKITRSKNLPSIIICLLVLALIILPIWFFSPIAIDESIKIYRASQQLDIVTPLKSIFPSLFASAEFSQQVGSIIHSFITKLANSLMDYLANILLEFPTLVLQMVVIFFTLYYTLRDKEKITTYIKSLLPFPKETEKKLFDSTRDITFSVLYGYVIIGLIQGIIQGTGFFLFGVPNAFLLSIIAVVFAILPILGPFFIGIPVIIFLIIAGNPLSAWGVLIFTSIASLSDHLIRPLVVSKRTKLHNALVFIGMIGGFFMFGILGFVLGPLIIAYLITIIEIYRKKDTPSILIEKPSK